MKWTREEKKAIKATMKHWRDDIIEPLKHGIRFNRLKLRFRDCPLCMLVHIDCSICPYIKFYHSHQCFEPGEVYVVFRETRSVETAIDCYNKVADMIGAKHYK